MSGEAWTNLVVWPECATCRSTGVAQEGTTGWPIQCPMCSTRRANAVKKAMADHRKAWTK